MAVTNQELPLGAAGCWPTDRQSDSYPISYKRLRAPKRLTAAKAPLDASSLEEELPAVPLNTSASMSPLQVRSNANFADPS